RKIIGQSRLQDFYSSRRFALLQCNRCPDGGEFEILHPSIQRKFLIERLGYVLCFVHSSCPGKNDCHQPLAALVRSRRECVLGGLPCASRVASLCISQRSVRKYFVRWVCGGPVQRALRYGVQVLRGTKPAMISR